MAIRINCYRMGFFCCLYINRIGICRTPKQIFTQNRTHICSGRDDFMPCSLITLSHCPVAWLCFDCDIVWDMPVHSILILFYYYVHFAYFFPYFKWFYWCIKCILLLVVVDRGMEWRAFCSIILIELRVLRSTSVCVCVWCTHKNVYFIQNKTTMASKTLYL